jgi:hypothetical protein
MAVSLQARRGADVRHGRLLPIFWRTQPGSTDSEPVPVPTDEWRLVPAKGLVHTHLLTLGGVTHEQEHFPN